MGTSWGTAGTLGVAFMGIGHGLGIPPAITAGAVISGAYFGDKVAPLSDSTNMAAAISGVDLIAHIKNMFRQTGIGYGLTIVVFLIIGFFFTVDANLEGAELIRNGLRENMVISPILLLPIIIVIVAIALKVPALPGIFLGVIVGAVFGLVMQNDVTLERVINVGYSGFTGGTGVPEVDHLLTRSGGIVRKFYAISIIIIALSFGGIMEMSRQLEVIVNKIIKIFVKGPGTLVATTVGTTVVTNAAMADQYLGIIIPAKMFATTYKQRGFHPKMLSGAVDGSGTLTSALVPWNTCAIFMASTLGVTTLAYLPFAVLNWSVPIIIIVMAAIGKYTRKIEDDPDSIIEPLAATSTSE
jgi:NhaC family Na+:H+ antiporter